MPVTKLASIQPEVGLGSTLLVELVKTQGVRANLELDGSQLRDGHGGPSHGTNPTPKERRKSTASNLRIPAIESAERIFRATFTFSKRLMLSV